jgi:hypothetical protein
MARTFTVTDSVYDLRNAGEPTITPFLHLPFQFMLFLFENDSPL